MEQLWELLHGQLYFHSHNLASVFGYYLTVHSLPLHHRPAQSLRPLSQRPLTKQASKACHTLLNDESSAESV
jgi:hypothetical protein